MTRYAARGRLCVLTLLLVSALTLARCGGDDEGSSESYANEICDDMTVWITALADADMRLSESGLSAAALEDAATDAKKATETLAAGIDQLEPPETEDSQRVRRIVDEFAGNLRQYAAVIDQTLDAHIGLRARVETVAVVVSSASKDGAVASLLAPPIQPKGRARGCVPRLE